MNPDSDRGGGRPPSSPPVHHPSRRGLLAAGAAIALGGPLAGCLDWLDEQLTFEATAPSVTEAAVESSGYSYVDTRELTIERTFEAGGQSQDVTTINYAAEYEKTVETPFGSERAAVFAALATPQVEVLGQTFNPVGEMSTAELAELIQEQYDEIGDLEHVDDGTVEVLGQETTRSRFRGSGELGIGLTIDVDVHITEAVESGEDFVVCVGAYPRLLSGELDNVETLMTGVRHDG